MKERERERKERERGKKEREERKRERKERERERKLYLVHIILLLPDRNRAAGRYRSYILRECKTMYRVPQTLPSQFVFFTGISCKGK